MSWWRAALRAEAAVLSAAEDAAALVDEAARACAGSETLTLLVLRTRALADDTTLAGLADGLDRLGARYQAQRTRLLLTKTTHES